MSAYSVVVGERVTTSTVMGRVGSTGLSTGCHLHFMVHRDGEPTDPMTLL
ncbi:M23 family metallopeptidase [Aeromicrobium sp.]